MSLMGEAKLYVIPGSHPSRTAMLMLDISVINTALSDIADALATLPEGRTPTAKDWNGLSAMWKQDSARWTADCTTRCNSL